MAGPARFTTLRATVRDWAAYRRISELQGRGWTGQSDEAGETLTHVWIDAQRRVREERASGTVRLTAGLEDAAHGPLFEPDRWLAGASTLDAIAERKVAGRGAVAMEVTDASASDVLPGANRCVWMLDRDRGVCLRLEAWLDDELLMVEELLDVVFDDPLDPTLFESP